MNDLQALHPVQFIDNYFPVIDGVTIKDYPSVLASGCDKPLLMGTVKSEANLFVNDVPAILMPIMARKFRLKPEHGKGAKERYADQETEAIYKAPARAITSAYKGPVWTYERTDKKGYVPRSAAACDPAGPSSSPAP